MKTLRSHKSFIMRYFPNYKPSHVASRYLNADVHPLQPKITHMYATRDKSTLWWMVNPSHLMSVRMKRVVRSWCSRRARMAFRLALKDHGFDADGRKAGQELLGDSSGKGGNGKNLKGRVDLLLHADILREPFEVLRKEMDAGVSALVNHLRTTKDVAPKPAKKQKKAVDAPDDKGNETSL
ncbi:hypothetical protein ABZX51_007187 [Aspergillus tubingensis]|uniref:Uncharacterized protein n=2 Tax=Aspergillus subgen. Circumdati TaxID=2720871 RepID=A0A1L9MTH6_ASPTC|nr:chitin biosynthesis protein [Aspergillus tubingensis]OJI80274.1 hypothetical protein ASPTUDRAFT_47360 [Aspergillus tubingensis CBS 134.48]GAQ45684.1 hypothetical protein An12g07890 [Aspergillus niger]GFN11646.1 chitin biosynthesis protein [Aspergillus tubingensis]GLA93362.1 hypothetical protein AtubIFM57143_010714 [Aspergillus tubingensis]GLB20615.1 hypothetical protein AtubIFM61612_010557 [Aspergillus tubingensis]